MFSSSLAHDEEVGSWDWIEHRTLYSRIEALAYLNNYSYEIHLYAGSHGNPEFPTDHMYTYVTLKIDLLKEDLESMFRMCNSDMY